MINQRGMKIIKAGGYRGAKRRLMDGTMPLPVEASKQLVAAIMLEDYDAACMVADQTETMEECVERCKQILVLKGEL